MLLSHIYEIVESVKVKNIINEYKRKHTQFCNSNRCSNCKYRKEEDCLYAFIVDNDIEVTKIESVGEDNG